MKGEQLIRGAEALGLTVIQEFEFKSSHNFDLTMALEMVHFLNELRENVNAAGGTFDMEHALDTKLGDILHAYYPNGIRFHVTSIK